MTMHVFVVDAQTFPVHLRYGFAGTGARDYRIDFNNSPTTRLRSENTLVGMIADVNRIRRGDSIVFYVQQNQSKGMPEGKFYGIFRATEDYPFIDDNDGAQFLKSELGKSLTFRVLFKPDRVYPIGVTEWEALDEIKDISKPNQMLWSLIYRKLKGNRGCTMITEYERERLCDLLDRKNEGKFLNPGPGSLGFNRSSQQIVPSSEIVSPYQGRKEAVNLMPRLAQKHREKKAFEPHLQAVIVGGLGRPGDGLSEILLGASQMTWLGNEVSCGVGMQRIDVMIESISNSGIRHIAPVELKAVTILPAHISQLQRYVDWIKQYFIPNRPSVISPALITLRSRYSRSNAVRNEILKFNGNNAGETCERLRLVEYEVSDASLRFYPNKY